MFIDILRTCRTPIRLWGIGMLIGVICAIAMSNEMGEVLEEYLQSRLNTAVSSKTWLQCLWINGRFMILLAVLTYIPLAVVWLQAAMAGYGFFFGFSLQIMARVYGVSGIIGAVCSYIPHNLFLLPVIACAVTKIKEPRKKQENRWLWGCVFIMAVLSSIVEVKTAPLMIHWCLEGVL